jgi:cytochrome b561
MIEWLRAWSQRHTERDRYSPLGIAFHWVMAALVLLQLGWGYYTSWQPVGGDKLQGYQVHSAIGLPILLLAMLRLAWRVLIPGPVNDADRLGLQTQVARATHFLFYLAFFGLPLSGWVMWSTIAEPGMLYLAGILPWPRIPLEQLSLETRLSLLDLAEDVHHILVVMLLILIPAHVGAALKHHFWNRHDVLRGMLPEIPDWEDPRPESQHRPRQPRLQPGSTDG